MAGQRATTPPLRAAGLTITATRIILLSLLP
jgi:hypothetical protein